MGRHRWLVSTITVLPQSGMLFCWAWGGMFGMLGLLPCIFCDELCGVVTRRMHGCAPPAARNNRISAASGVGRAVWVQGSMGPWPCQEASQGNDCSVCGLKSRDVVFVT
jgi:hypothetical protein